MKDARKRAKEKLTEQEQTKESVIKQRQDLLVHQQHYFGLVKKIQDEVKKNELINQKLEELN